MLNSANTCSSGCVTRCVVFSHLYHESARVSTCVANPADKKGARACTEFTFRNLLICYAITLTFARPYS